MAPAIGMQMRLVLLGLSSGLQLGQHRYARKVNQLAGMGGRGTERLLSDQLRAPFHFKCIRYQPVLIQKQTAHIRVQNQTRPTK